MTTPTDRAVATCPIDGLPKPSSEAISLAIREMFGNHVCINMQHGSPATIRAINARAREIDAAPSDVDRATEALQNVINRKEESLTQACSRLLVSSACLSNAQSLTVTLDGMTVNDNEVGDWIVSVQRKCDADHIRDATKMVELDYTPGELDRTAPDRIWLQVDADDDSRDEPFPKPYHEAITWCSQKQGGAEVEYVRADLIAAPSPAGEVAPVPQSLIDRSRALMALAAVARLADRWDEIAERHGERQFTGNDHKLFANELRAALAKAPAPAPAAVPDALSALYAAASKGFHVTETDGADSKYLHVSKFQSMSDLHAYEDAWRVAMTTVRDAAPTPPATEPEPNAVTLAAIADSYAGNVTEVESVEALLTAPVEAVSNAEWSGWATQYPGKMPVLFGAREIAELNFYPEEGQRLLFLTTQPPVDLRVGGSELDAVIAAVRAEIDRAVRKFPTWPTDPLHACGVVQEESGELAKAVLQAVYEPHKSTPEDVSTEAFQTAAMAIRFLLSMGRYQWTRGEQHDQHSKEATDGRD